MNKVIMLGRLSKDVEVRYTQSGKCVSQFSIAVNRPFKDTNGRQEADFFNCVAWGKLAETIGNYVHKGQRLLVEGRMQNRSYEAQDGSKRYVTELIVGNVEFIEKKDTNASGMETMGQAVPFDEEVPF